MGIYEKIEEIRQKPEHIRMRYVWFWVVVSMAFVVAIWVFSLKNSYQKTEAPMELGTDELFQQYNEGKDSIQNITQNINNLSLPQDGAPVSPENYNQ